MSVIAVNRYSHAVWRRSALVWRQIGRAHV